MLCILKGLSGMTEFETGEHTCCLFQKGKKSRKRHWLNHHSRSHGVYPCCATKFQRDLLADEPKLTRARTHVCLSEHSNHVATDSEAHWLSFLKTDAANTEGETIDCVPQ